MALHTPTYSCLTRKEIEQAQTLEEITAIMNLEQELYQQYVVADAALQALAPAAAVDDAVHPRAPNKPKSKTTVRQTLSVLIFRY